MMSYTLRSLCPPLFFQHCWHNLHALFHFKTRRLSGPGQSINPSIYHQRHWITAEIPVWSRFEFGKNVHWLGTQTQYAILNLHIWRWKAIILYALHAHFSFFFLQFADVLVFSTTWNDLFCSCVDDVRIWWQVFCFVYLSLKRWFQFDSRIVGTYFARVMT